MTAANSSSISDGAAALVMMRASEAEKRDVQPLARVVAHATHAAAPKDFPTAPIGALKKLFEKTGWTKDSVDLYEINEAFAVVAMAAMRDLGLPHEKVNVNGGALRARPSDRRLRRADSRHPDRRLAGAGPEARRRRALHRRRRGDGDRGGVSPLGRGGRAQRPSCALGVEREIARSSSVISAGTSANSGVLR